ncbi:MAG TPA: hypothetical protein VHH72_11440 [Solirubrobacterales bacterium]|jgi:hypothetical protein|nr:hypothetical protein [Solirubrobacterales bacterium]
MRTDRHEPRRPRHRRALALAGAVLALALALSLALAPGARAGVYVAVQCHTQQNIGAPDAIFARTSDHYVPGVDCSGSGVGLTIRNDAAVTKGGRAGAWSWYPPAGTVFTQITAQSHVAHDAGHKAYFSITDNTGNVQNRWPREGMFDAVDWAAGAHAVAFASFLSCLVPPDSSCGGGAKAHNYVRNLWFTLRDLSSPALTLSGDLLDPGPRGGVRTLDAAATDAGGGVWRWRVAVNGKATASAEQPCDVIPGGAARRFVPCPLNASRSFSLDTEGPPFRPGANEVTVCVSDVGWPANETCQTRTVHVDNPCRSSAGPAAALEASFAGGGAETRVASNRRARIAGRARGAGSGATVCVFATPSRPGAEQHYEGEARTGPGGRFTYLVPRGPSRRLRLVHRHGGHVVEAELGLAVRARPRLKVGPRSRLRNGEVARFRGKLPGPYAGGRVVVLQARLGERWLAFKTARTMPDGRFRASYRFRETTARRLYRFRAVVRKQAGYPYLAGVSPTRRVVVTG